jgi:ribosome-associated toxin RatA of RatAB toxin-antitoxin module
MYALVDDIESYQAFLPWCSSSRVQSRTEEEVRGVLELTHSGMHKSFTTLNRLQKGKMIEIRLVEGPFRHLEGFWRFEPLAENACKVRLDMDFEFTNKLVALAFGPVFNHVTNTLVDAFCQRAVAVYGKR